MYSKKTNTKPSKKVLSNYEKLLMAPDSMAEIRRQKTSKQSSRELCLGISSRHSKKR